MPEKGLSLRELLALKYITRREYEQECATQNAVRFQKLAIAVMDADRVWAMFFFACAEQWWEIAKRFAARRS